MTGDLTKVDFEGLDKETTEKSAEVVIQPSCARKIIKVSVFQKEIRAGKELPDYYEIWELSYNLQKNLNMFISVTPYYISEDRKQQKFKWEYKAQEIKEIDSGTFKMSLKSLDRPGVFVTATLSFNSDFSKITHFIAEEKIGEDGTPFKIGKLSKNQALL